MFPMLPRSRIELHFCNFVFQVCLLELSYSSPLALRAAFYLPDSYACTGRHLLLFNLNLGHLNLINEAKQGFYSIPNELC